MGKVYFTLTGTQHYYGKDFLKKGMKVRLIKEPENEYDRKRFAWNCRDWQDRVCGQQHPHGSRGEHERRGECTTGLRRRAPAS